VGILSTARLAAPQMQQEGDQPMHLSPQGISSTRKVKSIRLTTEVTMHLTPFD